MLLADWIAIGVLALFCLLGILIGFARGLRFFTGGFFGFIIAVIVCYTLGGAIYQFGFVQELLGKLNTALTGKNTFCDILLAIRIDIIVYYIALFIVFMLLRLIIVKIVLALAEIENGFIKVIDKMLGMVFFAAVSVLLVLIAFWVIALIGGTAEQYVMDNIAGSKLFLSELYEDNPLMIIIKVIKLEVEKPV